MSTGFPREKKVKVQEGLRTTNRCSQSRTQPPIFFLLPRTATRLNHPGTPWESVVWQVFMFSCFRVASPRIAIDTPCGKLGAESGITLDVRAVGKVWVDTVCLSSGELLANLRSHPRNGFR